MKVDSELEAILKYYVYVYSDPRTHVPFYIGKGKGNRVFDHLGDIRDSQKVRLIEELRSSGVEPQIEILRYGLTEREALLVEAAAIDLIGLSSLTNKNSGHHSRSYGRINSRDLMDMVRRDPVDVRHKVVLMTINKLYTSTMSARALYEATRGVWKVGPRREQVEYAFAVYQGIVREVYRIETWLPAGTLKYTTRDACDFGLTQRWEFKGRVAHDIRDEYLGKFVGLGGQNPIRYMGFT
ncbi:MAG: hypothetical protein MI747_02440 [Desulfobacterales bacterium]|nr:hypothetical protein [Desulfobacterales bacterium]